MGLEACAEVRLGLLDSRVGVAGGGRACSLSWACLISFSSSQPGAGVKYRFPILSAQLWALYMSLFIFHFSSR